MLRIALIVLLGTALWAEDKKLADFIKKHDEAKAVAAAVEKEYRSVTDIKREVTKQLAQLKRSVDKTKLRLNNLDSDIATYEKRSKTKQPITKTGKKTARKNLKVAKKEKKASEEQLVRLKAEHESMATLLRQVAARQKQLRNTNTRLKGLVKALAPTPVKGTVHKILGPDRLLVLCAIARTLGDPESASMKTEMICVKMATEGLEIGHAIQLEGFPSSEYELDKENKIRLYLAVPKAE